MFTININKFLAAVPAALALFVLAGCSSMPSMSSMSSSGPSASTTSAAAPATGVVQSVERVDQKDAGIGVGTIAGAVVGGLIGNQVGSGSGRTAATVAGAAGGALGGRAIENRTRQSSGQAYRVTLRMDDGTQQVFATETDPQFRVGDRVQVVNGIVQHY